MGALLRNKKKDATVPVFSSKQMLDMSASHQHVIDAFNRATQAWSWYIGVCQQNETDAGRKVSFSLLFLFSLSSHFLSLSLTFSHFLSLSLTFSPFSHFFLILSLSLSLSLGGV